METPRKTLIICSTPRTGSTLLCSLLKSTQLMGNPESYFRKQDVVQYAKKWSILENEEFDFDQYIRKVVAAGSTSNKICSVRIMWGTMTELVQGLSRLFPNIHSDKK